MTETSSTDGLRTFLWVSLSSIGIIFCVGGIVGFLSAHDAQGGGTLSATAVAVLTVFASVIAALTHIIWRQIKAMRHSLSAQNRRERMSWRYTALFGAIGAVCGLAFAFADTSGTAGAGSLFADTPVSPTGALAAALIWGVAMPIAAWFWHTRAIDEQEAAAYRDGGYYSGYAFLIIAPLWWVLWRGGWLPAPDGVAMYLGFATLWCVIWYWKKYR